jgi:hypothetical protein
VLIAATVALGAALYLERSYEGDEIAQETVPVLALILGGAAWLAERRLLRSSRPK